MGVDGLWKLIDSANCGQPVTLDSLEGRILAIDCSIWLNQAIKGIRDAQGDVSENAHLIGIFRRICKLIHYKIKPVFVFDGGVPELKKRTIQARKNRKEDYMNKNLERVKNLLKKNFNNQIKQQNINLNINLKSTELKSTKFSEFNDDKLFYLDDSYDVNVFKEESDQETDEEPEVEEKLKELTQKKELESFKKLSDIDINSEAFKNLRPELRHELLTEIKELKSYQKKEKLPEDSGDYSKYQLGKLAKGWDLQKKIEQTQKEMIEQPTASIDLNLKDEFDNFVSTRIASDGNTGMIFTKKKVTNEKPIFKKETPKKNFNSNIYGEVEEFDYGITEEVDSTSKTCLINERLIKKLDNSQNDEKDSSTDDSDFIEVEDDSIDNYSFSDINPVLLMNEKKVFENQLKPIIEEDLSISPNKRKESLNSSPNIPAKKSRIDLMQSFQEELEKKLFTTDAQENKTIELIDDSINDLNFINKSEIISLNSEEDFSIVLDETQLEVKKTEENKDNLNESKISETNQEDKMKEKKTEIIEINRVEQKDNSKIQKKEYLVKENISEDNKSDKKSVLNDLEKKISKNKTEIEVNNELKFVEEEKIKNKNFEKNESNESEIELKNEIKIKNDNLKNEIKIEINENKDEIELEKNEFEKEIKLENKKNIENATALENKKIENKNILTLDFLESKDENLEELIKPKEEKLTPKKEIKLVQLKQAPIEEKQDNKKSKKDVNKELSESFQLVRDIKKARRQNNTVVDSMIDDTKELLNLFGIPYVISPMEAEAQCACLELLNLTQGTVTDDGDVWLFGGKTVYKNFFNQSKFVMKYTSKEIEERIKMNRENLICFALLTGSDYTVGIKGVGPVTAVEIISEFKGEELEPLIKFKEWWTEKKEGNFQKVNKTTSKLLKYNLPKSFPSRLVFNAYVQPRVNDSKEKFKFAMPDLDSLRNYTYQKFHWSKEEADKILLPIFKRLNEKQSQTRIDSFFRLLPKPKIENIESKRIQKALEKKNLPKEENKKISDNSKKNVKNKKNEKVKKNKNEEQNVKTLKSKVMNQKRTKATNKKKTNIFNDKQVKINEFVIKKQNKPFISPDVIDLSDDSN